MPMNLTADAAQNGIPKPIRILQEGIEVEYTKAYGIGIDTHAKFIQVSVLVKRGTTITSTGTNSAPTGHRSCRAVTGRKLSLPNALSLQLTRPPHSTIALSQPAYTTSPS